MDFFNEIIKKKKKKKTYVVVGHLTAKNIIFLVMISLVNFESYKLKNQCII